MRNSETAPDCGMLWENIKFNNIKKDKIKKQSRLRTQNQGAFKCHFDSKKHYKFLKQNHPSFKQLNYTNQNQIKPTYLERSKNHRQVRSSCPILQSNVNRKASLKKSQIKTNGVNSKQFRWDVKQAINKLSNWKI